MNIAGHTFPDDWLPQVCSCGRRLTDILGTERADIGQNGIAHAGALNETEYGQIEGYREKLHASWVTGVEA